MVDYRRFLGQPGTREVVPFLGGSSVDLRDGRRLTVTDPPPTAGWYEAEVVGRRVRLHGPVEAPDLTGRGVVRGVYWDGRLVGDGASVDPLSLLPEEEPALFSPVKSRRWPGGAVLFEALEFETGVEEAARGALVGGGTLEGLPGVSAPLRAAFGLAVVTQRARERGVRLSAHEVRLHLGDVARGGVAAADGALDALIAERAQAEREQAELVARRARQHLAAQLATARAALAEREASAADRAERALARAGARLERSRRLPHGQLEVVFSFMGERFISLVDALTLQIIDSGICLGHPPRDELITLESLPSVIKEAIDTGALVILRWP